MEAGQELQRRARTRSTASAVLCDAAESCCLAASNSSSSCLF